MQCPEFSVNGRDLSKEERELAIRDDLLDELMKGYEKPEDLLGENGLLKDLTKRLLKKTLQGEMTHYERVHRVVACR